MFKTPLPHFVAGTNRTIYEAHGNSYHYDELAPWIHKRLGAYPDPGNNVILEGAGYLSNEYWPHARQIHCLHADGSVRTRPSAECSMALTEPPELAAIRR